MTAVGGIAAYSVISHKLEEREFLSDPVNQAIINRHTELARYHHRQLNSLRASVFPTSALTNLQFDAEAARLEAIEILRRRKRKRTGRP
ncbi:MAG: hypothetical protein K0U78_16520 [Actinomycetia bacterium]|nr:hypothetical protein [Actinomycetes bacterium]